MSARSLASALFAALLATTGCGGAPSQPLPDARLAPHLRLIGVAEVASASEFGGTTIGGLSAIEHDRLRGDYLAISDDRGADGPARVYRLRLSYDAQQLLPPEFTSVQPLASADGTPFAPWWRPRPGVDRPDAEGLRLRAGGQRFFWSSEGDFARGFGPQLRESRTDGTLVRSIPLPASFAPAAAQGPRRNGTLEGLALTPDGATLWLAMELPWRQDGPGATPQHPGAPVRITALDAGSGRLLRQIAYQAAPVPQARLLPGPQLNGVSEILADGAHHLLVLERSYAAGRGFGARLYRIDTRSGSDTQALAALTPDNHRPVEKTLVADLGALGLRPDNLEGMAWGPPLAGGGCVLVFVSDNNFNPAQVTQFIAAQYLEPPGGHGRCATNTP